MGKPRGGHLSLVDRNPSVPTQLWDGHIIINRAPPALVSLLLGSISQGRLCDNSWTYIVLENWGVLRNPEQRSSQDFLSPGILQGTERSGCEQVVFTQISLFLATCFLKCSAKNFGAFSHLAYLPLP